MFRHLTQVVDDYRSQLATKKEDIKRFETEAIHLESKIEQFQLLLEDIKKQTEEA